MRLVAEDYGHFLAGSGEGHVQKPRPFHERFALVPVKVVVAAEEDDGIDFPTFCLVQIHDLDGRQTAGPAIHHGSPPELGAGIG